MRRLIRLYQQMSDLTSSWCKKHCRDLEVGACCGYGPCQEAYEWAKERWGIELESTGHPTIPFLSRHGCVVAPHLRPICTVHICERAYMMNRKFDEEYFKLRNEISQLEYDLKAIRR